MVMMNGNRQDVYKRLNEIRLLGNQADIEKAGEEVTKVLLEMETCVTDALKSLLSNASSVELEDTVLALTKYMSTNSGKQLTKDILRRPAYIKDTMSESPDLIKGLICGQILKNITELAQENNTLLIDTLEAILPIFQEEHIGNAERAISCFEEAAIALEGDELALHSLYTMLEPLLQVENRTNMHRVLESITRMASVSQVSFKAFVDSNLMNTVASQFKEEDDPLLLVSLLELLQNMLGTNQARLLASNPRHGPYLDPASIAIVLSPLIEDELLRKMSCLDNMTMIRCHCMRLAASLQTIGYEARSLQSDELLKLFVDVLSMPSDPFDADLLSSTIDAMTGFTQSASGLLNILQRPSGKDLFTKLARYAIGPALQMSNDQIQEVALQSLACVVKTIMDDKRGNLVAHIKEVVFGSLRDESSGAMQSTLSGSLRQVLMRPDDKIKVSAYQCLSEIARSHWGAVEFCSNKEFIERIADSHSELNHQVAKWRYKCVCILYATASEIERMASHDAESRHEERELARLVKPSLTSLHNSVKRGVHGSGAAAVAMATDST